MNPEMALKNITIQPCGGRQLKQRLFSESDHEIWFEIFERLPIKSLYACRSVCKPWKSKIAQVIDDLKLPSSSLPLCGLLLRSSSFGSVNGDVNVNVGYLNLTTGKITGLRRDDLKSLKVRNASDLKDEYRPLSNLSFNFRGLYPKDVHLLLDFNRLSVKNSKRQSSVVYFAVNKGFLLVVYENGDYVVYNPLIRKCISLPKPPSFRQCKCSNLLEKVGFIIKIGSSDRSAYRVVRLCRVSRVIEVYRSYRKPKSWKVSKLTLDDEELMQACWRWENYVAVNATRTLFFLTNKDRGVAIKFGATNGHEHAHACVFGLPRLVQQDFENARLGQSRGWLHLSYYNRSGVWVWKHVDSGATLTHEARVPLLEISVYNQICKPLGKEYFCCALNAGNQVIPMAFHPRATVVFFRFNSSIVTYNLENDHLEKVAEIDEEEFGASTVALPYCPSLALV